ALAPERRAEVVEEPRAPEVPLDEQADRCEDVLFLRGQELAGGPLADFHGPGERESLSRLSRELADGLVGVGLETGGDIAGLIGGRVAELGGGGGLRGEGLVCQGRRGRRG